MLLNPFFRRGEGIRRRLVALQPKEHKNNHITVDADRAGIPRAGEFFVSPPRASRVASYRAVLSPVLINQSETSRGNMKHAALRSGVLTTVIIGCLALNAAAEPLLYWGEPGEIRRTPVSALSGETVVDGLGGIIDIAYDPVNDRLYIADGAHGIYRWNTNTNERELVLPRDCCTLSPIAVAAEINQMFLAGSAKIFRAALDGTALTEIVDLGSAGSIVDIDVDAGNGKIYWALDGETSGAVQRANFDGTGIETILSEPALTFGNVQLDSGAGKIYVTDSGGGISRANLDGSGLEVLNTSTDEIEENTLTLDLAGRKAYWATDTYGQYSTIGLDGDGSDLDDHYLYGEEGRLNISSLAFNSNSGALYAASMSPYGQKVFRLDWSGLAAALVYSTPVQLPLSIIFAGQSGKMYWLDGITSSIMRSNVDGSNQEVVVQSWGVSAGCALDEAAQQLYWTDAWGTMFRSGLDGRNIEPVMTNMPNLGYVAVDNAGGYLYFNNDQAISRAPLNNLAQSETLTGPLGDIFSLYLDPGANKLYWTCVLGGHWKVQRMNVDGSDIEDLITLDNTHYIAPLAIDFAAGKFYLLDREDQTIRTANLDGSNPGSLFPFADAAFAMAILPDTKIYATWNRFLGMVNVLELVNLGTTEATAGVTVRSAGGEILSESPVVIPAGGQRDIILNDLPGVSADTYGTVAVDSRGERLKGRVVAYAAQDASGEYDYAIPLGLQAPLAGTSYVNSNTFSPGTNQSALIVKDWLALVNLASAERTFTVTTYGQDGALISEREAVVPAFARQDIEVQPGEVPGLALVKITPGSAGAPYLAQLFRYGAVSSSPGVLTGRYAFGAGFPARQPSTAAPLFAPVSRGGGALNWIEIVSTSAAPAEVVVEFFDWSGVVTRTENAELPGYGQKHLFANDALAAGSIGSVRLTPAQGSIISQSMFYFPDGNGSVAGAYGSLARASAPDLQHGSYNLFLGMQNWLKLTNITGDAQTVTLKLALPSGAQSVSYRTLAAHDSLDLGLHEFDAYGTLPDTYGMITVETSRSGALLSELLRLRPAAGGGVDFTALTTMW